MCPLVHIEGIVSSKLLGTIPAGVGERVGEVLALDVVAHVAHGVVGELETHTAGGLPRGMLSCHVNIEVFWLCKITLNIGNKSRVW